MKLEAFEGILPLEREGWSEIRIAGIASDSRKVGQGYLFAALPGTRVDGTAFVGDAIARGAAAVVIGGESGVHPSGVPLIGVADPRRTLALAAARFFGAQPRVVAAVTGTSGKTSVASFTRQIWSHAGHAAASIGTTGVEAPGLREEGSLTTPDPVGLHALLARLHREGITHAAMEASSHGLDQHRLDGVVLAAAAFTNLGRDHLDYHPTAESYFDAKMLLFERLLPKGAPAIIFADDAWSERAADRARKAGADVRLVGRHGGFVSLKRVEHERFRQRVELEADGELHEVVLPLAGDFQIANALVALGLALSTGVEAGVALAAIAELRGAPGRLEYVGRTPQGAPAYVDYAHKPEALRSVLQSVRPFTTGKIVLVFGCGGDRDRGKRPIMGAIAAREADLVIVTDDNPRSEEPAAIRAEILAAAPGAIEIGDRREAIRHAIGLLGPGDTLIVAGKGHETGQTVGNVTLHFSDHEEVRQALKELAS